MNIITRRVRQFLIMLAFIAAFSGRNEVFGQSDQFIDGKVQRLFTSADGLRNTASNAIAQTTDGFIWIGGYAGLVRYDGRTFEDMGSNEIQGILDMKATDDGALYVATADKGLYRYDHGVWDNLSRGRESVMSIQSLAVDEKDTVWFGTASGAGKVNEDQEMELLNLPELEGLLVHRILTIPGEVAFITRGGEYYRYDGKSCKAEEFDAETGHIRCASYDEKQKKIYLGTTENSLIECDTDYKNKIYYHVNGLDCLNDAVVDEDGVLWVCADNGIAFFHKGRVRLQKLGLDNSIDRGIIDAEGNYWFVSSRQGVLEVSDSYFTNISQIAGLDRMIVNAISESEGKLYIGHDEGLLILNGDIYRIMRDENFARLDGVRIRDLKTDAEGNIWVATKGKGLLCYRNNHRWISYNMERYPQITSNSFRCIYLLDDGRVIAGTESGAYLIDGESVQDVVKDQKAGAQRILSICAQGDTIYLGSDGYGLYLVQDGNIVAHYGKEDGLTSNVIMKMTPSEAGEGLWLVTGNKLVYLNPDGSCRQIEGLNTTNNLDVLIREGKTWILTGGGIYKTTEQSLLEDDIPFLITFSHEEGLPFEITANSNQLVRGDTFYICGSGGIASLLTEKSGAVRQDYQLAVDSARVDGVVEYVRGKETITIPPRAQRVDLNAHVLTYGYDNPIVFYYLEGFDSERILSKFNSFGTVTYTNLNGGPYRFHFGILDKESGEVTQEVVVPVFKNYRWYEKLPVQVGLAFGIITALTFLLWLIFRQRTEAANRRIRQEYEKIEQVHLREAVYKDFLTGINNRNFLEVWNEKILPEAEYPITFISVDCNNLKKINDNFGHKQGDWMLRKMAELLDRHFCGEAFSVMRVGGDEYLVLGCGVLPEEVDRILAELREDAASYQVEGIPVTFCAGVCVQNTPQEFNLEEGLRISDMRMLDEKAQYHGRRQ